MKNEFGVKLDRNGYAPSLMNTHGDACWRCARNGSVDHLDRHEVFGGANRQKSKEYGLWVTLCHDRCHQGKTGVHASKEFDQVLKRVAQGMAMREYGWSVDDFRARFRNNYLELDEEGES